MKTVDELMALADRYAFHIPGSQHSDEARAVLLAALQEQAPKRLWGMAGFNPPLPNVGEKYTSIHEDDLGDHVTVTGIANASSPNIAYVFLSWDDGHYGERAIDEFWQEYMMVQTNDQAREGEAVAKVVLTKTLGLPTMQWLGLDKQFDLADGQLLYTTPQAAQPDHIADTNKMVPADHVDSINTSKERVENDRANVQVQAREGEAIANSAILARGRFHAFKGEDGEPDAWEWFEEGTNCEHGCIDAVIVRADAIAAPQPAQPSDIGIPITQSEQGPSA